MILLTGATGFLGSFVLEELLRQGFEVMAAFRRQCPIMEKYPSVHWFCADLGDASSLAKIPSSSKGIIHLASTISSQPAVIKRVDIMGNERLLSKWGQGPFIFVSSTDVYGPLQMIPADENHPLEPSHWYGWGKATCENHLRTTARSRNSADFAIFRPPYILGPHKNFALSLVGKMIDHAKKGGEFILPAKWRPDEVKAGHSWVSAHDLACWLVTSLRNGITGTYNATSGFATWKELIGQIIALTGGFGRITFKEKRDRTMALCDEERCFSSEKLMRALPPQGATTLQQTLAQLVEETGTQN